VHRRDAIPARTGRDALLGAGAPPCDGRCSDPARGRRPLPIPFVGMPACCRRPLRTGGKRSSTFGIGGRGPSQDSPRFPEAMRQVTTGDSTWRAAASLHPYRLLADKGYDAEHNHQLRRESRCTSGGVHSTVIPLNPRNRGRNGPKTRYRREMKREFPRQQNGQRWLISSFSKSAGYSEHAQEKKS